MAMGTVSRYPFNANRLDTGGVPYAVHVTEGINLRSRPVLRPSLGVATSLTVPRFFDDQALIL
jgi:hypothetical protein